MAVWMRYEGKTRIDVTDFRYAEQFFVSTLGMTVTRREHNCITLESGGRLRVCEGPDGGIVELATDEILDDLQSRLSKLGYLVDLLPVNAPQFLEVELGYSTACKIYPVALDSK